MNFFLKFKEYRPLFKRLIFDQGNITVGTFSEQLIVKTEEQWSVMLSKSEKFPKTDSQTKQFFLTCMKTNKYKFSLNFIFVLFFNGSSQNKI